MVDPVSALTSASATVAAAAAIGIYRKFDTAYSQIQMNQKRSINNQTMIEGTERQDGIIDHVDGVVPRPRRSDGGNDG
jgi:hypothetical protein